MSQTSIQQEAIALGLSGNALKRLRGKKGNHHSFQASRRKPSARPPQEATAAPVLDATAPAAE